MSLVPELRSLKKNSYAYTHLDLLEFTKFGMNRRIFHPDPALYNGTKLYCNNFFKIYGTGAESPLIYIKDPDPHENDPYRQHQCCGAVSFWPGSGSS